MSSELVHACAECLELQHMSGLKHVIVIQFINIIYYFCWEIH